MIETIIATIPILNVHLIKTHVNEVRKTYWMQTPSIVNKYYNLSKIIHTKALVIDVERMQSKE